MLVVIIGAGIIGLALARELRRRGHRVLLIDRGPPAHEASWAAGGLLAPSSEAAGPGDFFELCRASAVLYPDFTRALEEETDLPCGYRGEGTIVVYHEETERRQLEQRFAWQRDAGIPIAHLDDRECRTLEPQLRAPGGFLLPGDCQVDNRLLCAALLESCRRNGVAFVPGEAVAVSSERDRATGVLLRDETRLPADAVVNAAGAWAGQIAAPGGAPPVRPVKGHMLAMRVDPAWLAHVVHDSAVYMAPRRDGRLIAGSTMEDVGFDRGIDPAAIARLRAAAERLVPRLRHAELAETWVGFRPAFPDRRPRIGPAALPGYFLATGHFRNGILLAPITAQLLAPVIEGASPDPLLVPFLPSD